MAGVIIQPVTQEIAESMGHESTDGALISDISPGSPAEKAGLRRGDLVVKFDGEPIKEFTSLSKLVGMKAPGASSEITILRDGKREEISVVLGKMPDDEAPAESRRGEDIELSDITPDIAARFGVEDKAGVLVTNVNRGSSAWEAGFRSGDVIMEVNKNPVANLGDYNRIISGLKPGKQYLFLVKKRKNTIYIGYAPKKKQ